MHIQSVPGVSAGVFSTSISHVHEESLSSLSSVCMMNISHYVYTFALKMIARSYVVLSMAALQLCVSHKLPGLHDGM